MDTILPEFNAMDAHQPASNPFFADGEIPDSVAEASGLKHRLVFDARLSEGLGFTKDDLAANRTGEMTDSQKETVFKMNWLAILGWLIGLVFVFVTVFYLDQASDGATVPDWWENWACCLIPITLVLSMILAIKDEQGKERSAEKRSGKVMSITGAVFSVKGSNNKIMVDNQVFRLPKVTGPIFARGRHYVVYYEPESKMIVAAERIDYD